MRIVHSEFDVKLPTFRISLIYESQILAEQSRMAARYIWCISGMMSNGMGMHDSSA